MSREMTDDDRIRVRDALRQLRESVSAEGIGSAGVRKKYVVTRDGLRDSDGNPPPDGGDPTFFEQPIAGNRPVISQKRPWRSTGAGCHSRQVDDFNSYYRELGILGAHHEHDGTLVCESRNARREVCVARGLPDNDAGYGDYSGNASDE